MNKKQKIVKKMAKREKAKQNKIEKPKVGAKPRYISKAERARLEAETSEAVVDVAPADTPVTEAETAK
ncbi:hypothetical protein Shewmr4_1624 [Shewanella sp. MR-4]|uniref:DUF2986 domain-containing protein n=1 Tax=Shewanella sp. (strain MR-4) TaxID=60480 RepID=UPI00005E4D01|nr:DUF2986 domain-containing protein [Shewanella sp. MR-4]ABI38700.1 hypothetical protein Shewmr4_1624 [Shewanella sp. MR-4]